jgi:hypothetical protein
MNIRSHYSHIGQHRVRPLAWFSWTLALRSLDCSRASDAPHFDNSAFVSCTPPSGKIYKFLVMSCFYSHLGAVPLHLKISSSPPGSGSSLLMIDGYFHSKSYIKQQNRQREMLCGQCVLKYRDLVDILYPY